MGPHVLSCFLSAPSSLASITTALIQVSDDCEGWSQGWAGVGALLQVLSPFSLFRTTPAGPCPRGVHLLHSRRGGARPGQAGSHRAGGGGGARQVIWEEE